MSPQSLFTQSARLEALAMGVTNEELINDQIAHTIPVSKREFRYDARPIGEQFTAPDNLISARGSIPELGTSATQRVSYVQKYGYWTRVLKEDMEDAQDQTRDGFSAYDPMAAGVRRLKEAIDLAREARVALLFNDLTNFWGNQLLGGTSMWDDPASDPIQAIERIRQRSTVDLNTLVIDQAGHDFLRRHPRVVETYSMSGAGINAVGQVPEQELARILGVKQVLVGKARINAINVFDPDLRKTLGTTTLNRVWGANAALIHVNPNVRSTVGDGVTWAANVEYKGITVYERFVNDEETAHGETRIKMIEDNRQMTMAPIAGYLFRNIHNVPGSVNINELTAFAGNIYNGV
jgi:hypothetical protein